MSEPYICWVYVLDMLGGAVAIAHTVLQTYRMKDVPVLSKYQKIKEYWNKLLVYVVNVPSCKVFEGGVAGRGRRLRSQALPLVIETFQVYYLTLN